MSIRASRYHDFCAGHTVTGHESKCAHMHGHNYRVHFEVQAEGNTNDLDAVGRVLDFSVIKEKLCDWLEANWDHKFLIWERDLRAGAILEIDPAGTVIVPFNPTAENMGQYILDVVAPTALAGTGCYLRKVVIEETRKCSVTVENN